MDETATPRSSTSTATGLAIAWLSLSTIGCLAGVLPTGEVAVNASMITFPLFVSGWGAAAGAIATHKRDPSRALAGVGLGAVIGLVLGVIGLAVAYTALWPGCLG